MYNHETRPVDFRHSTHFSYELAHPILMPSRMVFQIWLLEQTCFRTYRFWMLFLLGSKWMQHCHIATALVGFDFDNIVHFGWRWCSFTTARSGWLCLPCAILVHWTCLMSQQVRHDWLAAWKKTRDLTESRNRPCSYWHQLFHSHWHSSGQNFTVQDKQVRMMGHPDFCSAGNPRSE